MSEQLKYKIALSLIPNIGDVLAKKILAYCGSLEAIFKQKKSALLKIPGIGEILAASIVNQNVFGRAEEEMKFIENNNITTITDKTTSNDIRWNDFQGLYQKYEGKCAFNTSRGIGCTINKYHVKEFLDNNNINFIIRGHQDDYANSYLLSNYKNTTFYGVRLADEEINSDIIYYNNKTINNDKRMGSIARILLDKNKFTNKNNKYYYSEKKNKNDVSNEIYPVLTISTNTDVNRSLTSDSFLLLRFDLKQNNVKDFNNNFHENTINNINDIK